MKYRAERGLDCQKILMNKDGYRLNEEPGCTQNILIESDDTRNLKGFTMNTRKVRPEQM